MTVDINATRELLALEPDDVLEVFALAGGKLSSRNTYTAAEGAPFVGRELVDVYATTAALRPDAKPPRGRARVEDLALVRLLLVDCDPEGVTAAARGAARALAERVRAEIVERVGARPALVSTGRGSTVVLRVEATAPDDAAKHRRKRILSALGRGFRVEGAKVDESSPLNVGVRLLGSTNSKTGEAVALVEAGEGVASVEKIEAWLVSLEERWPSPRPARVVAPAPLPGESREWRPSYVASAVEAIIEGFRATPEGRRNGGLNAAAFSLAALEAGGARIGAAFETLAEVALDMGLSEIETAKTIASGVEAGRRNPRTAPPDRPRVRLQRDAEGGGTVTRTNVSEIAVSHDVLAMTDAAEAALLSADVPIFHRGGELVRIKRSGRLSLSPVGLATLLEELSAVTVWLAPGKNGEDRQTNPPRSVVEALAARVDYKLRALDAVTDRPTLREDGSILDVAGYDGLSRVFYEPSGKFPTVPQNPTKEEARAALDVLCEGLADFPWSAPCDRSAALSLILTLAARRVVRGPVPFFVVRAPERGVGKSLLADLAAIVATGSTAPRMTHVREPEEQAKVIVALGREGAEVALIDNVENGFGSDVLAAVGTATVFKGRVLGSSRMVEVPLPTFCVTGVNVTVRGDLGRRVLPIDLDAHDERPEERQGFRHADLIAWAKAERPRLLASALTAMRWFFAAGCPTVALTPWGSYEGWTATVRSVLVALGEGDPCAGRERIREEGDPELEAHRRLFAVWAENLGEAPWTVPEILEAAGRIADLREALAALDHKLDANKLDGRRVGYQLRRLRRKILDGRRLESGSRSKEGLRWWLVPVKHLQHPETPSPTPPQAKETAASGGKVLEVFQIPTLQHHARAHARAPESAWERETPATPEASNDPGLFTQTAGSQPVEDAGPRVFHRVFVNGGFTVDPDLEEEGDADAL